MTCNDTKILDRLNYYLPPYSNFSIYDHSRLNLLGVNYDNPFAVEHDALEIW